MAEPDYEILAFHVSPDGALTFEMTRDAGGDLTLYFHGHSWHTHGDLLAETGEDPLAAAQAFVDDLLNDRILIAICRSGEAAEIWATYDPEDDLLDAQENETMAFRLWSGARTYRGEEILAEPTRWRTCF